MTFGSKKNFGFSDNFLDTVRAVISGEELPKGPAYLEVTKQEDLTEKALNENAKSVPSSRTKGKTARTTKETNAITISPKADSDPGVIQNQEAVAYILEMAEKEEYFQGRYGENADEVIRKMLEVKLDIGLGPIVLPKDIMFIGPGGIFEKIKAVDDSEEEITEISSAKKGAYVSQAMDDLVDTNAEQRLKNSPDRKKELQKRLIKRTRGIHRAMKEEEGTTSETTSVDEGGDQNLSEAAMCPGDCCGSTVAACKCSADCPKCDCNAVKEETEIDELSRKTLGMHGTHADLRSMSDDDFQKKHGVSKGEMRKRMGHHESVEMTESRLMQLDEMIMPKPHPSHTRHHKVFQDRIKKEQHAEPYVTLRTMHPNEDISHATNKDHMKHHHTMVDYHQYMSDKHSDAEQETRDTDAAHYHMQKTERHENLTLRHKKAGRVHQRAVENPPPKTKKLPKAKFNEEVDVSQNSRPGTYHGRRI